MDNGSKLILLLIQIITNNLSNVWSSSGCVYNFNLKNNHNYCKHVKKCSALYALLLLF